MGHRQPCVRALTRTVRVWKQDCGGRPWCAGYERRYVLCRRAWLAPCAVAADSSAAAAAAAKPLVAHFVSAEGRARRAGVDGERAGSGCRRWGLGAAAVCLSCCQPWAGTGDSPGKHLGPPRSLGDWPARLQLSSITSSSPGRGEMVPSAWYLAFGRAGRG